MVIRVQQQDFNLGDELAALGKGDTSIGGVCSFVGLVRDFPEGAPLQSMTLEHYPAMTERELMKIDAEAHRRWALKSSLIIHRYGELRPGDQIVLVATASPHRDAAFDACRFLIDWLKTRAPFWKKEETAAGTEWVAASESDDIAAGRWESEN